MEKLTIEVVVRSPAKSGRTSSARVLRWILSGHGCEVRVVDDGQSFDTDDGAAVPRAITTLKALLPLRVFTIRTETT